MAKKDQIRVETLDAEDIKEIRSMIKRSNEANEAIKQTITQMVTVNNVLYEFVDRLLCEYERLKK